MRNLRVAVLAIAATLGAAGPVAAGSSVTSQKAMNVVNVSSIGETAPVGHAGDAADDPAIWVDPANAGQSLIIGNDKLGALEVYDLSGARVQRIAAGSAFFGNVDVRGNWVAVSHNGVVVYQIRPATHQLGMATDGSGKITASGEGLCLFDPGADGLAGGMYVFTVGRADGHVREYALGDADGDGMLNGSLVREFTMGSESEACVADDATGSFFVSEEDVAIWRYGADPGDGAARTKVAAVGPNLPADAEGLAIAGDYLFASAQSVAHPNQNFVNVYFRTAPYTYLKSVRIVAGDKSDDCDRTDGIAAYAGGLGARFPHGLFVCQDGDNSAPGTSGHQNFKLVPLQDVAAGS